MKGDYTLIVERWSLSLTHFCGKVLSEAAALFVVRVHLPTEGLHHGVHDVQDDPQVSAVGQRDSRLTQGCGGCGTISNFK